MCYKCNVIDVGIQLKVHPHRAVDSAGALLDTQHCHFTVMDKNILVVFT